MKPKILVNIHYLEIGGAEAALIGMLQALDPERVEVDLMVNDLRGPFVEHIPGWVNVIRLPKAYRYIERPAKETLRAGCLRLAWARWRAKRQYSRWINRHPVPAGKQSQGEFGYVGRYVSKALPGIGQRQTYDLAISFLMPHDIVLRKIQARKKIAWIHTDYSRIHINADFELPVWEAYDNIVSISPAVTESFLEVFPSLKEKIVEIEN